MVDAYKTIELLEILEVERQACLRGDRLSLTTASCGASPFIDQFLESSGLQRFSAYDNFRSTIHDYQKTHQISGIVWESIFLRGRATRFPVIHEQLASLPSDRVILANMKSPLVVFWQQAIVGMNLYLALQGGKTFQSATIDDVAHLYQRTQWAKISQQGEGSTLEIILELGWGNPEEACYRRGFPDSGSEHIHAVYPENQPLG
jgi:hypothetical protein